MQEQELRSFYKSSIPNCNPYDAEQIILKIDLVVKSLRGSSQKM